ncbi:hypothetical protein BGX33_012039 [Mortierella sp. NVP41]|nr:hypothetical protein BGX33_012039 [Mortierella sp. NVP41]
MVAWMIFLFALIGIAASDFFCPNLNTISKKLHMSESMAGVTILAFGNASPDIFSTFSAVGAGSGTLAVGEVVGASSFIMSIVIGSMAIVKPFKVSRGPFLRDMIFFTGCILFILYMVLDRKITFVQSVLLMVAYIVYVALVVFGNWKQQRGESRSRTDTETGSEYSEDSGRVDESDEALRHQTGATNTEQAQDQHTGIAMGAMDQSATVTPPLSTCAKPSSSFKSKSKCPAIVVDPAYSAANLSPSTAGLSTKGSRANSLMSPMPSPLYDGPSQDPSYAQLQQVMLHHSLILPDMGDPTNRPRSPVFQSAPQGNSFGETRERHRWCMLFLKDWVKPVYFPTLLGWKEKSLLVKVLAIASIPMVLLLTLTLPVVDLKEDSDTLIGSQTDGTPVEAKATSPDDGSNLYNGWCQGATMVQTVIAPVFITAVVASATGAGQMVVLVALGLGIVLSSLVFYFSTEERPPRFYEAFAFAGFLVAMTWIVVVANEVVGILQAVGLILGVSDAILGLTVFAMGNSLGDLVSNITIAKMGFPQMAFSACFGGPLLNMLLGLGMSGTYVTLSTKAHIPLQVSPTLLVSLGGILLTLVGAMVVQHMADQHTAEAIKPHHQKTRQASSTSTISFASESSLEDKPEWFTKDTSVQYQKTSAEVDPAVGFFYTPRTLTILGVMLLSLVYVAMTPELDDTLTNVKIGVLACIGVFCVFGMLQFRDSLLLRPHPALWRVVLSLGVVYQLFLVFLLFQNKHDARRFFTYLDPSLGIPLPEKSYGDACELTYDNIVSQVFDEFVVAHALGWFCKALILRDYTFCWILSVMFEVMEYSLSHQLNNFDECWWDHWILDVLICNWLGMYLGVKTCEYFEMKQYSWQGLAEIPTLRGKMKRSIAQFTPKSWTKFEWDMTKSFKSYCTVLFILTMFLICELNAFYLKTLLWIPPAHSINVIRIFAFFMFGIPGVREAYQYFHDVNCKRIGPQAWLLIGNIATEVLIVCKFGIGEFPNPAPKEVIYFWVVFLSLLTAFPIYQFFLLPRFQDKSKGKRKAQ